MFRTIALLLALSLAAGTLIPGARAAGQTAPWPTEGWERSTPEAQGLDRAPLDAFRARIDEGDFGNVDRVVVVRHGFLVLSERWDRDYDSISAGRRDPLGCGGDACRSPAEIHPYNYYHADWHPSPRGRRVHTLQSVTKSVTSALIGIAIGRGEVAGVEAPLLSFFPAYDGDHVDPRLRRATLDDLLTMRSGIEWHESDRPLDETNTTLQLERSPDWIRFTLEQPMDAEPGEKWVYSSGGSQLMSGVVRQATGMHVDAYAERHLFGPLGIRDYYWKKTPTGHPDTEGGLYLEAEDLARIGYLYLRGGAWGDRRILPDGWVEASTARRVASVDSSGSGYGYQWWRLDRPGTDIWAGLGFGGQYLVVIPSLDIVGVVNSWNVFGGVRTGALPAFIDALLAGAGAGAEPGAATSVGPPPGVGADAGAGQGEGR